MKPFRTAAAALAALVLCFTPARAGEDSVEIAAVHVDVSAAPSAEDVEGTGTAYSIAYARPISKRGFLSSHFALERVDGIGAAGQGGYSFGAGAQFNFGDGTSLDGDPPGPVRAFLRGSLGGHFADARTVTAEAPVPDGGTGLDSHQHDAAAGETVEVDLDVSDQYMTASAAAGVRFLFGLERTLGFGIEGRYELPLNDGIAVEHAGAVRAFLVIPVEMPEPPLIEP